MNNWSPILAELERKRAFSLAQGGEERIAKQHAAGKLTARERAAALFDDGRFVEIGALAANLSQEGGRPSPADGLIAAYGKIGGQPALTLIEDFTVQAGSIGDAGGTKRQRVTSLALQERVPLVMMLEGAGHRLTNKHGRPALNDLQALAALGGKVPIVTLVMGPAAGHSALAAPMADFAVMTRAASLFVAGPPIVKAAIGEDVTKEQLGGPDIHLASGVVHNLAEDDAHAIAQARYFLSLLAARQVAFARGDERREAILDLIDPDPRRPFDAHKLLDMVADSGTALVIQPQFGGALITALARIGGRSVAVVANNPMVNAGSVDARAAQKGARFLAWAERARLPVVFLTDNPGVQPGTASERAGTLRYAAEMFAAQAALTVPKLHVTLRKAFGFGSSIMAQNPFDNQTINVAFPAISLGAMPAASGAQAARLTPEEAAAAARKQTEAAWEMADKVACDDVIDPRDLRVALLNGLELAAGRLV